MTGPAASTVGFVSLRMMRLGEVQLVGGSLQMNSAIASGHITVTVAPRQENASTIDPGTMRRVAHPVGGFGLVQLPTRSFCLAIRTHRF
jgi:hypothetical protein